MADSGHFDGFRAPLSSALFCIRLVTKHCSKITEDRSMADRHTDRHILLSPPMQPSSRPFPGKCTAFLRIPGTSPCILRSTVFTDHSRGDILQPFPGSVPIQCDSRALSPGESAYPAHSSDSVGGRRSKRLAACLHATPSPATHFAGVFTESTSIYS